MKKGFLALSIAIAAVLCMLQAGCDNSKETETESTVAVTLGETFTDHKESESFYLMRIGDKYRIPQGIAAYAEDPGVLPDLEDGQIAHVTADVKVTGSTFGYNPGYTYYITKLISSEPVTYEEAVKDCNIPELGKDNLGFHSYKYNGKIYLIVTLENVCVYTGEGKFMEYERPSSGQELYDKFLEEVKKR